MGKYLDLVRKPFASTTDTTETTEVTPGDTFGRFSRFGRTYKALEQRCPDYVPVMRWQQAVEDGKRFLTVRGDQAEALGWSARDLFGLHTPHAEPHPSYQRLSRYDCTGLIWLLEGRAVAALAADTATIRNPTTGTVTTYTRSRGWGRWATVWTISRR